MFEGVREKTKRRSMPQRKQLNVLIDPEVYEGLVAESLLFPRAVVFGSFIEEILKAFLAESKANRGE